MLSFNQALLDDPWSQGYVGFIHLRGTGMLAPPWIEFAVAMPVYSLLYRSSERRMH